MKIVAFGEPMIELAEQINQDNQKIFVKGYGGDSSNFSIACARQEADVAYLTALGNDSFGQEFLDLYRKENVDVSNVLLDDKHHTGLYFIHYDVEGHHFSYLRKNSAASKYTADKLPLDVIENADCLFVSGITQAISNECCDSVFKSIEVAKANNVLVVYDPNLRLKLWTVKRAKAIIHETVKHVDIFMPSYEDAKALTGLSDEQEIIDFYHGIGVEKIILKLGSKGVMISIDNTVEFIKAYKVDAIDQTGAGDTFDGSFVTHYLRNKDFYEAAKFANAAAALSTLGVGAVAPIPTKEEVEKFIRTSQM